MNVTKDTELRSVPLNFRINLSEMLDLNDAWKKLAAVISNPEKPGKLLYTAVHVNIFESGRQRGTSPSSLLLSDWETRGRVRPTVQDLLDLLIRVELFQAADYVAVNILKGDFPKRPDAGPAASISPENFHYNPVGTEVKEASMVQNCNNFAYQTAVSGCSTSLQSTRASSTDSCSVVLRVPDQESGDGGGTVHLDGMSAYGIPHLTHAQLFECTKGFSVSLGKGAFGEVYWGELRPRTQVAVKKLTFEARDQFMTELHTMTKYRHPNLLPLIGYSNDIVAVCCLVSPFMANGSLEDRLAQKNRTAPLTWQTRLNVAIGTARGVAHLHTCGEEPLVHRDIKSANILLDEKFDAKVGDFGIARIGGDWQKTTKVMTSNISGTCAYMSSEAFHGNVTVKMDTFSFGIVLLELLTGLPPDDPSRENRHLLSHVLEFEGEMSAQQWRDPKAGDWPDSVEDGLLDLAVKCTEDRMKKRPLMNEILQELGKIAQNVLL